MTFLLLIVNPLLVTCQYIVIYHHNYHSLSFLCSTVSSQWVTLSLTPLLRRWQLQTSMLLPLMTCGVTRPHAEKTWIWWDSWCFCLVSCLSPPGMPAAYDLSTVIGSGPSVSHNNLIPLGTNHTPPGSSTSRGTWSSGEQIGEQQRKSAVQHEVPGMHENNWFLLLMSTAALYDMEKNYRPWMLSA